MLSSPSGRPINTESRDIPLWVVIVLLVLLLVFQIGLVLSTAQWR